jgi:hypothetical protein
MGLRGAKVSWRALWQPRAERSPTIRSSRRWHGARVKRDQPTHRMSTSMPAAHMGEGMKTALTGKTQQSHTLTVKHGSVTTSDSSAHVHTSPQIRHHTRHHTPNSTNPAIDVNIHSLNCCSAINQDTDTT